MTDTPPEGPQDGPLRLFRDGSVAFIAIARPEKRNALDDASVLALEAAFTALQSETDIGAVVLHSTGDTFCAGLDLSEVRERDAAAGVWHSRMWHRALAAIEGGRLPVVAVLRGAVIGGGLELAAAAHIRVAEASAFYALPEGQRGIYVGGGGSVRLPRLIGVARMQDMMLTGRTYAAQDGMAAGFSQYVVPDGQGLAKATGLARRMAQNAPLTTFAVLHALPRIAEADPATGYLTEALMAAVAQSDPEAKARIRAFLDKRAAKVAHDG